jgi:hypothetical protein
LMHVAVTTIFGGRASVNAGKGTGGRAVGHASFYGLIWADSKHCCWPGVSSNPPPKGHGNIFGISDERPIANDRVDVNADLVMEV